MLQKRKVYFGLHSKRAKTLIKLGYFSNPLVETSVRQATVEYGCFSASGLRHHLVTFLVSGSVEARILLVHFREIYLIRTGWILDHIALDDRGY